MKFNVPFIKKKEKEEQRLGNNVVRINVKRFVGDSLPYTIADFDAIQDSDGSNNLVLVNQSENFKEDVEIVKEKLIADIDFTLDLHKLSTLEKIEKLKSAINYQEKLLKDIRDGYVEREVKSPDGKKKIEKIRVNNIDENLKLQRYKVFLESLQNSGEGSYEEINIDGRKMVSYLYKGGILYPYKILNAKHTYVPDITSKRKIYKSEQDAIDQEYQNDNRGFMSGWKQYLWIALVTILILGNVYGYVKLSQAWSAFDESTLSELMDKAEGSAISCAYYYATIGEETEKFINAANEIGLFTNSSQGRTNVRVG